MKNPLIIVFLAGVLGAIPCLANVQRPDKIDNELQQVFNTAKPSDLISIIIVFKDKPIEDQLSTLEKVHSSEITYNYTIINAIAGKALAEEIPKIAEYDWVKQI